MVYTFCITMVYINNYKCWPMPNVMAAVSNIGGAICSIPHFGWQPLLDCHTVTLPRRKSRWNLQGCPKVANRCQSLVGRNSPTVRTLWGRYCWLHVEIKLFYRILHPSRRHWSQSWNILISFQTWFHVKIKQWNIRKFFKEISFHFMMEPHLK